MIHPFMTESSQYGYTHPAAAHTHAYLLPIVATLLAIYAPRRIFELGCGNGYVANELAALRYEVTGVDPSPSGVQVAQEHFPAVRIEEGSTEEDLAARFGKFECVLSLEVVEHVFMPREFAARVASLLGPGGIAIISTPYHSYLKDLIRAAANKRDDPLWDYGHIKAFRREDLRGLFNEVGMFEVDFHRVGRIPQLAKSMVCVYRRPTGAV